MSGFSSCSLMRRASLLTLAGRPLEVHDRVRTVSGEQVAGNLATSFTGPLALVAIVIGGLLFMFAQAGAKRQLAGIVFGRGPALFGAQFLTRLF
jgi:hypothetical protein